MRRYLGEWREDGKKRSHQAVMQPGGSLLKGNIFDIADVYETSTHANDTRALKVVIETV